MRYRNSITGGFVITDRVLAYPYQPVHETVDCWCEEAAYEHNKYAVPPDDGEEE